MTAVQTGLERFCQHPNLWAGGQRLGLLCNPAAVDWKFRHVRELIHEILPGRIKALFAPQHGFFAEKQDNMIESDHAMDPLLGVPIFSLYGETRTPLPEMLESIDTLIVDLQDAGTRVYTFIYTLSYCMEAAGLCGKKIIVLDRPNPVGGIQVEGNVLNPQYASFVGRFPMPMRHGLTIGELARMFAGHFGVQCDLEVVPMNGWNRSMYFRDTGLPWVAPSPNLPAPESARVYPGQVIWEGTNISEGRGTTQPFEIFGAPFLNINEILSTIKGRDQQGFILRPLAFEPTSNKWAGQLCKGFQIHITDPEKYRPYASSLRLLQAILLHHRDEFRWKPPPYEYEFEKHPIDLIIGDRNIRDRLEQLEDMDDIEASWADGLEAFRETCRRFYLYDP